MIAPILEAQLMETFVLNQIHLQSLAVTKAVRVVEAAAGRRVVDFGSRRAHGTEAAIKVARATYLAGGAGTSNVLAGRIYGIPVFGTMAHSYVQAHDSEAESFEAFAAMYPGPLCWWTPMTRSRASATSSISLAGWATGSGFEPFAWIRRPRRSRFRDAQDVGQRRPQARRDLRVQQPG